MNDNDREVALEQLNQVIKQDEEQLRIKKAMAAQLNKKPSKPLVETGFVRGMNHFFAFMTAPFAAFHGYTQSLAKDPHGHKVNKDLETAEKILNDCRATISRDNPEAGKLAVKAAQYSMYLDKYQDEKVVQVQEQLDKEITRLRPATSTEKHTQ